MVYQRTPQFPKKQKVTGRTKESKPSVLGTELATSLNDVLHQCIKGEHLRAAPVEDDMPHMLTLSLLSRGIHTCNLNNMFSAHLHVGFPTEEAIDCLSKPPEGTFCRRESQPPKQSIILGDENFQLDLAFAPVMTGATLAGCIYVSDGAVLRIWLEQHLVGFDRTPHGMKKCKFEIATVRDPQRTG